MLCWYFLPNSFLTTTTTTTTRKGTPLLRAGWSEGHFPLLLFSVLRCVFCNITVAPCCVACRTCILFLTGVFLTWPGLFNCLNRACLHWTGWCLTGQFVRTRDLFCLRLCTGRFFF
jgi:hypothetical protein